MASQATRSSIHDPLVDPRNRIRLIEILPADSMQNDWIRCRLSTVSLDDRPNYTALSYVWGDPDVTRQIVVNDTEFDVTTNLFDALSQVREDKVGLLWVDAICIDQENDEEKGHQVQKMSKIYQDADKVVVWLGREDGNSKKAMELLKDLAEVADSADIRSLYSPYYTDVSQDQWRDLMSKACTPLLSSASGFLEGDIGLIVSLMDRHYWDRLWTLQEIGLARTTTLMCGSARIPFETAQKTVALLKWFGNWSNNPPLGFDAFDMKLRLLFTPFVPSEFRAPPAFWVHAHRRRMPDESTLAWVLSVTCDGGRLECLDSRDRIYALLGLLPEPDRSFITADYSISYVNLFAKATMFLLRRHGPRTFTFAGLANRSDEEEKTKLSSWMVDWRCTRLRGEGVLQHVSFEGRYFPLQMLDTFHTVLKCARVGEVIDVVPLKKGVHCVLERFEQTQHDRGLLLPEDLKRMVWKTMLRNAGWAKLSVDKVDCLFKEHLRPSDTHIELSPSSNQRNVKQVTGATTSAFEQLLWIKSSRNFFMTAQGMIGSGPPCTEVGDVVHVIPNLDVPVLLRPDETGPPKNCWKLVGLAYVNDIVDYTDDGDYFTMERYWSTDPKLEEVILS